MAAVMIYAHKKATAKRVLDKIAEMYGLNYYSNVCATGNRATCLLNERDNTITFSSSVFCVETLEMDAKKVTRKKVEIIKPYF